MIPTISQARLHKVQRIIVDHIDVPRKKTLRGLSNCTDIKQHGDRKVTTSTKETAHKLLEEYLQDSSLHGVKYLDNLKIKPSIFEKVFWILIIISSFVFLSWMINTFWVRYKANPVHSVIESFQDPIFLVPFPAITLCPAVPPLASRRRQLLRRLQLPRDIDNKTASFLLKYGTTFLNIHIPGSAQYLSQLNELLELNKMQVSDMVTFLRPCEDMLENCWFGGIKISCRKLFTKSYTNLGVCCSFNYLLENYIQNDSIDENKIKLFRTAYFGPSFGLAATLHRDLLNEKDDVEDIRFSANSIGVMMFLHHPLEYIGAIAVRRLLQAHEELRVAITPYVKKTLGDYFRQNDRNELEALCANKNTTLEYFPLYLYSNCFTSCSIKLTLQSCGCVPYFYMPVAKKHKLKICQWQDYECLNTNKEKIRVIQNIQTENFTCKCLSPCTSVSYESQEYSGKLNRQDFNVSPLHKNLSKTQSVLKVYMSSETYTVTNTIPVADELYLLASFGGIFSLFMGCSFISALEIFYFVGLFLRSYYNSKKSRSRN